MNKVDLIIHRAGQLVTCAAASYSGNAKKGAAMRDLGIIENGAVAIKDGVIAAAGTSEDIFHEFTGETTIDAAGKVVMPGFVECHTHIVYAGDRLNEFEMRIAGKSYLEIMEAGGGIVTNNAAVAGPFAV